MRPTLKYSFPNVLRSIKLMDDSIAVLMSGFRNRPLWLESRHPFFIFFVLFAHYSYFGHTTIEVDIALEMLGTFLKYKNTLGFKGGVFARDRCNV